MSKVEPQLKLHGGNSGGMDSPAKEMKSATPPPFQLSAQAPVAGRPSAAPESGEGAVGELIGGDGGKALLGGGGAPPAPPATPPATPAVPPAPTPAAITISTSNHVAPTWGKNGYFNWVVYFNTNATNGWIVQEIINVYNPQNAAGQPLGPPHATPRYYEAWSVGASSQVEPGNGVDNDYWTRPNRGDNTQGNWSMTGNVYFTTTDPATQGFAARRVPDAGDLLSSTTAPAGLGTVKLVRRASGSWNSASTPAVPHTGSAA